jgi:hypothetical protein
MATGNGSQKGTIRIECLSANEPAKPVSLHDSIAAFDAHLDASRDLFTMWVKDIPARVFRALPKNFAIPQCSRPRPWPVPGSSRSLGNYRTARPV